MLTAVRLARTEETAVKGKPRYDSKSKGIVENTNGLVKVLLRTWLSSLASHYGVEFCAEDAVVQWAVRHCGWSLTRFSIASDGLTPYWRLRGKGYGGPIAEIGETALFHDPSPNSKFTKQ